MRHPTPLPALSLVALLALGGCGDDDPTGPGGPELFVGTFDAVSMIFTPAGGGAPIDVIPLGASLTVTVDSDGNFSWMLAAPGEQPQTQTGTLDVDESTATVTVDFDSPTMGDFVATYAFSGDGNTLTLQADDVAYDLNGDGTDDAESVQVTLTRR